MPLPSNPSQPESMSCSVCADSGIFEAPHLLEIKVQHRLENYPSLKFHQLVVHRTAGGVCLQGILDENPNHLDLCELVREFIGNGEVLNQVVYCPSREQPA